MGKRSFWMKVVAAVASGLLVAGLFPPFSLAVLAWLALVPLLAALWSLDGPRAGWKGFFLAWLAGALSSLVQFYWLSEVSWLGALLLPLYLGCFWGLFGSFAATLGNPWRANGQEDANPGVWADLKKSLRVASGHGAVWAGLEWLRGGLFTGFGWNGLGVAFHETPIFAQAADVFGVAGLSLVVVFFQAALVQAGGRRDRGTVANRRRMRMDIAIAVAVMGVLTAYGLARIEMEKRGASERLKTLLVQINIPQDAAQVLWSALDVHLAYEDETLKALENPGPQPDWVMWPESALTGRILRAADGAWGTWRENQETIARVRAGGPFQLIFGVNELEADSMADGDLMVKPHGRVWNSIAVIDPLDHLQTYQKRHLVMFGETIPFVDSIPILKKIYEQQAGVAYGGSFTPGESLEPLVIPTADGTRIGAIPTVCFEDSVPRLTRKFLRPGPQVIVNVTNDGWFRESAAAAQHFANARFRAIELRRPMLRCANSGVSAAIDTTGSTAHPDSGKPQVLVDSKGSHFTRGSLLTELKVPLVPSFSLYGWIGDWAIILLALATLAVSWKTATKPKSRPIGEG